jgi:glycerol-3-phosphate cytidylyltransferase
MTDLIMVDMSATLFHHGHVRLLQKASELGRVIVALTTDDEVNEKKGYTPELSFSERKEILLSIRYVDEVVPSPWLITEEFLDLHKIDVLVHGDDHQNPIPAYRTVLFPRTQGISSSELRKKVMEVVKIQKDKHESP